MFKYLQYLSTSFDSLHGNSAYRQEQYEIGVKLARDYDYLFINRNMVHNGGTYNRLKSYHAYERLGYHACTMHLFAGMVSQSKPIYLEDEHYNVYMLNYETMQFELLTKESWFVFSPAADDSKKLKGVSHNLINL